MGNIWPALYIELMSGRTLGSRHGLNGDQIAIIRQLVSAGRHDILSRPITLPSGDIQLALVPLGPDGVGDGKLYLQVTTSDRSLKLAVISYGSTSGPSTGPGLLPDEAEDLLHQIAPRLRQALGLREPSTYMKG